MAKKQEQEEVLKSFDEVKQENEDYIRQLSKRSAQYIYELKKILSNEMNVENQERALNEILPQLICEQKKGVTARQLLGPVQDCARLIIEGPKEEPKEMPMWQMWLDNSLLIFVLLGAFSGIMGVFSENPMIIGIVSMIISAVIGGGIFYLMYRLIYQYDRPGADKSKKPKTWKSMLIIIALMFVWIAALQLSMVWLPSNINVSLTPIWMLIISALVYGVRYLLKRQLGYSGSFFNR